MKRRGISLTSLAVINLGAGMAVQFLLLARYGAGTATDALIAASTIPQLIMAILVGAAVNVTLPLFAGRLPDRLFEREAWVLLSWSGMILAALAIAVAAAASVITDLLVPGLSPNAKELARTLTVIQAVALPLMGLCSIATALHQAQGRFVEAENAAATTNVLLVGAVFYFLPSGGIILISWLIVARSAGLAVVLLSGLGRPRVSFALTDTLRQVGHGIRPLVLSTSYFKVGPLLDRWLASFGSSGDITILEVLQQIFAAIATLMSKSVVAPMIASLAEMRKAGADLAERRAVYFRVHRSTSLLSLAAYAAALIALIWFAPVVLQHQQAERLQFIFIALAGLYTAGFLGQQAAAWFYAEERTDVPARVGATGFSIGIAARFLFVPLFGTAGIAAALSINQVYNWAMMNRRIRRSLGA